MFIKKDLRKIPKILEDAVECDDNDDDDDDDNDDSNNNSATTSKNDEGPPKAAKRSKVEAPLSVLRLGRRKQEFEGSIRILCQPKYLPKLQELQNLNLYDCAISNLDGIGLLQNCPQLRVLNVGRNPLTTLPDELAKLSGSLKELWLDDCQLTGPLPPCVAELEHLESFRAPNNQITEIPDSLLQLKHLKVLVLDRNPLILPDDFRGLVKLEELYLRQTNLAHLPRRLPTRSLKVLHASSNPLLTNVDSLLIGGGGGGGNICQELTQLYLNGCQLSSLPPGIVSQHPKLERLVVSHNTPTLRHAPIDLWHAIRGKELVEKSVEIVWQPNPQLEEGTTEVPSLPVEEENENHENGASSSDSEDEDEQGASIMAMEGVELISNE
jgi:Leucine-rich repeat (LRR) protein